jgi:hypothetical protein
VALKIEWTPEQQQQAQPVIATKASARKLRLEQPEHRMAPLAADPCISAWLGHF